MSAMRARDNVPEARMPLRRSPGNSDVLYHCSECRVVIRQVEDDRFRE
jgi:hypothetical protein